jgi:hypothetical protein
MVCGFSLRIQVSSRIVKITISRPKEILVAVINATLLGEFGFEPLTDFTYHRDQWHGRLSLKSLRMRELQMDWLRSET